jgi:hypothetical protein
MTHPALRLTTRSKARNTQRHALHLIARSEAMTHLALRLTARSEARNTQRHALRLTERSEAMTHLALHLTARLEARNKYIYTPPIREGPFGLYQAYLESVQTCYPRYLGITRRSCLEAHMVLDMEYESRLT